MMKKGMLFIFEGVDNVGKTTIISELCNKLGEAGIDYANYSFPGSEDHTLGALVYDLHHNVDQYLKRDINPISLQLLHVASHIDILINSILPDLNSGKIVILDRSWWSTYAYGKAMGISKKNLKHIINPELELVRKQKTHVFLIKRDHTTCNNSLISAYAELENENLMPDNFEVIMNNNFIVDVVNGIFKKIQIRCKQNSHRSTRKRKTENRNTQIITTPIYDEFWRFAAERQEIFFRRFETAAYPWTNDSILQRYKFTNAYRASDRVSQYLIRNVIYSEVSYSPENTFFRIMLFKLFNKIETWCYLEKALGAITYKEYSFEDYDRILSNLLSAKEKIYSGAYIMPSGKSAFGFEKKHKNHLRLLEFMMEDQIVAKIAVVNDLKGLYDLLLQYPTFGKFLAFQLSIDINYSELCDFDEMSYVVAGPGARSGIEKCFLSTGEYSDEDIIQMMADKQHEEFERLGLDFKDLWGRPLQLIDCQNLFCETDKYSRVAFPEYKGQSGRSRIKQLYNVNSRDSIDYFYPPKWGINERIKRGLK